MDLDDAISCCVAVGMVMAHADVTHSIIATSYSLKMENQYEDQLRWYYLQACPLAITQ